MPFFGIPGPEVVPIRDLLRKCYLKTRWGPGWAIVTAATRGNESGIQCCEPGICCGATPDSGGEIQVPQVIQK